MKRVFGLLIATTLCTAAVHAQEPKGNFNPGALKRHSPGQANEVMVIGTAHLAQLPSTFQPASVQVLLERLRAWRPTLIATENLSGPQCDAMRRYPRRNSGTVKRFCTWDPAPAFAATGLDVPAATAAADELLTTWPAAPTPAQRRHLAAVFLAGGEPISALVQWLRLPDSERHAGDGLDQVLVEALEQRRFGRGPRGEDILIAAPLAAALGLERVVSMDDQSIYDVPKPEQDGYAEALSKVWQNPVSAARMQLYERLTAHVGNAESAMSLYRTLNDPSQAMVIYNSDFGAALQDPTPQQFGRDYVASWEARNLRMAANIREAIGNHQGGRTLVIVGISHKWYLEAYLNQMHDVRIVSSDAVLR